MRRRRRLISGEEWRIIAAGAAFLASAVAYMALQVIW
jgi:hypothetical protein